MRKFSSAGQENLLVPDKAEISSVLDKAENPLVADTDKNLFVPVKKTLFFFFCAHRTNDLTKQFAKVRPFECDELEKHCRVSAKCYPTKVPAL